MESEPIYGDRVQNVFIDRPIRRISIFTHKSDIYYSNPQVDKQGNEIISNITQDRVLFESQGKHVFYLWRKTPHGSYCWKQIINMPVLVEYDDELALTEKK